MPNYQARLKPQFAQKYTGLNSVTWYEVEPLWPGHTDRNTNLMGPRMSRLRTGKDHSTVLGEHLDFRERPRRTTGKAPAKE
jgi:hypothetical protein